ncbi:MAG: hypothetical protein GY774_35640 [Planctomycetes bacterium]|nr:hypothetical protein [Planctomycetota bacterium]
MALPPVMVRVDSRVDDLGKKVGGQVKYLHEKLRKLSNQDQVDDLRSGLEALQKKNIYLDKRVKGLAAELKSLKILNELEVPVKSGAKGGKDAVRKKRTRKKR